MKKSEVMIMKRRGGKMRDDKKWEFSGNAVKVTKTYEYLEVK